MSELASQKNEPCRLIASIGGEPDHLVSALSLVDPRTDWIEVRLDQVPKDAVQSLIAAPSLPIVATCRRKQDGGQFEGDEIERGSRLEAASRAGAAWIDLEWGSDLARHLQRFSPARIILSWHDFNGTPPDLGARFQAMRAVSGISLFKVVPTARRLHDLVAIRDLLRETDDLIAFAMGETGVASRVLAPVWGSRAIYAAGAEQATAPGQVSVGALLDQYRFRSLSPRTRMSGLLGRPLGHSLSPRLHNKSYATLSLDWVYVPFESESVEDLRDFMIALEISGVSVTLPHKEQVLSELDEMEPLVRDLGAANTIVRSGGRLRGHNTDAEAALAPLRRRIPLQDKKVVLLGAGGAARAFAFMLPREGCTVTVYNRTEERAKALACQAGIAWGRWNDLAADPYDLLIQTTPVGMHPRVEEMPVPREWLRGSLIYDIIYNPAETALLRAARSRGIETLDGVDMFVGQAAAQFELFTGVNAPRETMNRVMRTV